MAIKIDGLADAVAEALTDYEEETEEKVTALIDRKTDEVLKALKNSPELKKLNGTGKYAKSFYKKTVKKGKGYKWNKVANKKYRIGHLLEEGHEIFTGKTKAYSNTGKSQTRTKGGRTRSFPHYKEAGKLLDNFEEEMAKELEK